MSTHISDRILLAVIITTGTAHLGRCRHSFPDAAVGDRIACAGGEGDVIIGEVVGHRSPNGVVVSRDVVTGETFGVGPDVIVGLGRWFGESFGLSGESSWRG